MMKGGVRQRERIQQGVHHIILKKKAGRLIEPRNNQKLMFQNIHDQYTFLYLLQKTAIRFHSSILAFVLMDTHVHLLVKTSSISLFIGTFCSRYAKTYNKKYSTAGRFFLRTFTSFIKEREDWQIDTLFYILNNPIEAGICHRHKDYFFSSYKQHIGQETPLNKIIDIDNYLIKNYFNSIDQFKTVLGEKLKYQRGIAHIKYSLK